MTNTQIGRPLTSKQAAMLVRVEAGLVRWADPHPGLAARTGWSSPRWIIEGREAEYAEGPTLDRLVERGFITAPGEGEAATAVRTRPGQSAT